MTIDTLEVEVAALQRLPETGSESQVGLHRHGGGNGDCRNHSTCFMTCLMFTQLEEE
jgi:hypothetical protein